LPRAFEYNIASYKIRLNIWYLIIFLLLQTLLNELGTRQLKQASDKQVQSIQLANTSSYALSDLNQVSTTNLSQFQLVSLELSTISNVIFFQQQHKNEKKGYQVFYLVEELRSGKKLLLDRGWVAASKNGIPVLERFMPNKKTRARLFPLEANKTVLADTKSRLIQTGYKILLPEINQTVKQQIEQRFELELENYLLRLSADDGNALNNRWRWTKTSSEQHLYYAMTYFALSLLLLVVGLIACTVKKST